MILPGEHIDAAHSIAQQQLQPDPDPDPSLLEAIVEDFDRAGETDQPTAQTDPQLHRLGRILRHRARIESEIERELENHKIRRRQLEAELAAHSYLYAAEAEQLTCQLLAGKRKSVQTPWGRAGFRKQAAHLEVVDANAVPGAFLKIEAKINKQAINDTYRHTGEIIEGCELVPETETFYMG